MAKAVDESVAERARRAAEPIARSLGLELVEVEYLREGPRWVLRMYVDKAGGVTLEDCTGLTHALGPLLEVEEIGDAGYALEVSSPGLDRPLRKPEDFRRFAGERAKIRTYAPLRAAEGLSERKSFSGVLVGCEDGQVALEVEGVRCRIPLAALAKANLIYDFSKDSKTQGPAVPKKP